MASIIDKHKHAIQEDIHNAEKSAHSSRPVLYGLPLPLINGRVSTVDKLRCRELKSLIPLLLKKSSGQSRVNWNSSDHIPNWWPIDVPWGNVKSDTRPQVWLTHVILGDFWSVLQVLTLSQFKSQSSKYLPCFKSTDCCYLAKATKPHKPNCNTSNSVHVYILAGLIFPYLTLGAAWGGDVGLCVEEGCQSLLYLQCHCHHLITTSGNITVNESNFFGSKHWSEIKGSTG